VSLKKIGVWFPAIRTGTGTEVFTVRLVNALKKLGVRAEIAWLPHYAEYLPWVVPVPVVPAWVTVVHVNTWLHSRFIPKNLPVIATMHSATYDDSLLPYKSFLQKIYHQYWIRACEQWCIDNATTITAVSHYAAAQTTKHLGRKDVVVIHNWVDVEVFCPEKFQNKKKNKTQVFSIAFVGTPCIRKGVDLLPKIMRALGEDFQLKLTATMNQIPGYPDLPKNMISIERLHDDSELVGLYRSVDLLLFPSRLEGFGLVALEAQACGLPVVATNGSALCEIVQHGISGILCPQDDVDAFVAAIKKIASNKDLRLQMGNAGHIAAKNNFSENFIIGKYLELYSI
jgi:glycosyltransferase involved in cell wall biosynthesis